MAADTVPEVAAFDLDGTLVDSALDFDAMREELGFPPGVGLLEHIDTLSCPQAVAHAHRVIRCHEMAGMAHASWIDGAVTLLEQLRVARVPTAVLTRNTRAAVESLAGRLELPVDLVLTREDCAPKPSPAGLLHIAANFSTPPSRMIYVGDFVYDLRAARAAGATACLLRRSDNAHFACEADITIETLSELGALFPRRFGSG